MIISVLAAASVAAAVAATGSLPLAARILPLGDSLTLGVQGQGGGYRSPLGQALKGYGSAYNAGFVGGLYLAGDHSGYSGHTISGILGAVRGARTMEINEPTHVLLLGGTNDFYFYPPLGADASTALQRMETLLMFLVNRTAPPQIFLATVPSVLVERCAVYSQGPCAPTIASNIASFNAHLPALVAQWQQKGARLTLVNMSEAGFAEPDYWTAGIHFNDNGWCKMAKVWAKHLMPTLPKRTASSQQQSQQSQRQQQEEEVAEHQSAAYGAFADPVAQVGRCRIPGATATATTVPPPYSASTTPTAAAAAAAADGSSTACAQVVTVNLKGTPPSFAAFYANLSTALPSGLKFGGRGGFCAWSSLQPAATPMAPWAQHGVVDAWESAPSPSGAAFSLLQSLGSELLETTVEEQPPPPHQSGQEGAAAATQVHLALGTLRRWATQTTVSVVVNATDSTTSTGAVCLDILGLAPEVASKQCGTATTRTTSSADRSTAPTATRAAATRAAATAVELVGGRDPAGEERTTTRMLGCEPAAKAGVVRLRLAASPQGTASAVSFAISHL